MCSALVSGNLYLEFHRGRPGHDAALNKSRVAQLRILFTLDLFLELSGGLSSYIVRDRAVIWDDIAIGEMKEDRRRNRRCNYWWESA